MNILHVVGKKNKWAIHNRAENLARIQRENHTVAVETVWDADGHWAEFDLIHCHSIVFIPMTKQVDFSKTRFLVCIPSERSLKALGASMDSLRHARFVIAKNPRLRDMLMERNHMDASFVRYLPNGVHQDIFRPAPLRVGYVCRKGEAHRTHKGANLIDAAVEKINQMLGSAAVESAPDPGDYPDSILSPAEMTEYYRSLDVFACASESEGCSNVVLEALACGVPVVSTDVGIARELAFDCDLTVVNRSTEGLFSGILKHITPALQRRNCITQWYDMRIVAKQYEELYQEAMGTCNP